MLTSQKRARFDAVAAILGRCAISPFSVHSPVVREVCVYDHLHLIADWRMFEACGNNTMKLVKSPLFEEVEEEECVSG